MHLLQRPDSPYYYYNQRLPETRQLLRFSLHTANHKAALKAAHTISRQVQEWQRLGMDYRLIKKNAYEQALKFRDEWLEDFYSEGAYPVTSKDWRQDLAEMLGEANPSDGKPPAHNATTTINDKINELVKLLRQTQRRLITGYSTPDEVEDDLAGLMGAQLTIQALEEHRKPEKLIASMHATAPVTATTIVAASPTPEKPVTPPFSELYAEYLADWTANKGGEMKQANANLHHYAVTDFYWAFGDRSVENFTRKDAMWFRDVLLAAPKNRTQKFPELKAQDVIDNPVGEPISSKNASDRLNTITTIFKYFVKADYIPKNPFDGVNIKAVSEQRPAFTNEDINKLLSSELFTNEKYRQNHGRRSQFWALLLALYTGARAGELIQLRQSDIITRNGILCLSINDEEGKTVKSSAAIRTVPIHKHLLEIGFEEYLKSLPDAWTYTPDRPGFLLPGFRLHRGSERPYAPLSKWFHEMYRDRFLPEFKAERKVFHSFRHTFIRNALACNALEAHVQTMVGHETGEFATTKVYVPERFTPAQLQESMNKLEYTGIDIEVLRGNWRGIKHE